MSPQDASREIRKTTLAELQSLLNFAVTKFPFQGFAPYALAIAGAIWTVLLAAQQGGPAGVWQKVKLELAALKTIPLVKYLVPAPLRAQLEPFLVAVLKKLS